jgi:hypothetical protein
VDLHDGIDTSTATAEKATTTSTATVPVSADDANDAEQAGKENCAHNATSSNSHSRTKKQSQIVMEKMKFHSPYGGSQFQATRAGSGKRQRQRSKSKLIPKGDGSKPKLISKGDGWTRKSNAVGRFARNTIFVPPRPTDQKRRRQSKLTTMVGAALVSVLPLQPKYSNRQFRKASDTVTSPAATPVQKKPKLTAMETLRGKLTGDTVDLTSSPPPVDSVAPRTPQALAGIGELPPVAPAENTTATAPAMTKATAPAALAEAADSAPLPNAPAESVKTTVSASDATGATATASAGDAEDASAAPGASTASALAGGDKEKKRRAMAAAVAKARQTAVANAQQSQRAKAQQATNAVAAAQTRRAVQGVGRLYQSGTRSCECYTIIGAIMQGLGQPGVGALKGDRGKLPNGIETVSMRGRTLVFATTEVAKTTDIFTEFSSGNFEKDVVVKINDSFRCNSLGSDCQKRDWEDFVTVAMEVYRVVHGESGTIFFISPRSVSRAVAMANAVLLQSSETLVAETVGRKIVACLAHSCDDAGSSIADSVAVYSCALLAFQHGCQHWVDSGLLRQANTVLDFKPTVENVESDGETEEQHLDDLFDYGPTSMLDPRAVTRTGGQRMHFIQDSGTHDVVPWSPPTKRRKKRKAAEAAASSSPPLVTKKKQRTSGLGLRKKQAELRKELDQMESGHEITCLFPYSAGTPEEPTFLKWEDGVFLRVQTPGHTKFYTGHLIFQYGEDEWSHARPDLTMSEAGILRFGGKTEGAWCWGNRADELNAALGAEEHF